MRKRALVTGGATGIGAETARLLTASGYDVAIAFLRERAEAETLARELTSHGSRAFAVQADISREADVVEMFAAVDREFGGLDALVSNAGVNGGAPLRVSELTETAIRMVFEVNALGTILCAREAARRMSTMAGGAGGAIVNVSSLAGTFGGRAGRTHYAASKAAIDAFTIGFAREVAQEGIRVNAVRPGFTLTPMTERARVDSKYREQIADTIPMKRCAEPIDVARPILWLLSEDASYITGALIDVAGGGLRFAGPELRARGIQGSET